MPINKSMAGLACVAWLAFAGGCSSDIATAPDPKPLTAPTEAAGSSIPDPPAGSVESNVSSNAKGNSIWPGVDLSQAKVTERGNAVDIELPPHESLKDVDTSKTSDILARLMNAATRDAAIAELLQDPSAFAPPAAYALASALFAKGQRQEALFWYHAGQLRARSDANKTQDVSARQAVGVLRMQYGQPINEFAFQDTENLRKVILEVLEWDRTHQRAYDPRWIELHGMGAFLGNDKPFAAESEWAGIDAKTRDDYLKGMEEGIVEFQKRKREMDTDGDGVLSEVEKATYREKQLADIKKSFGESLDRLKPKASPPTNDKN